MVEYSYYTTDGEYEEKPQESFVGTIYLIFHNIIAIVALYISFRCNMRFDLLHVLCAIIIPVPYLIYMVAIHNSCVSAIYKS
jgi:hypothetical protein